MQNRSVIAAIIAAAGAASAASAQSSQVFITEVFYNPSGSEAETEWVEIYNGGNTPVDISNWVLADEDNNSPSDPFGSGALLNFDGSISAESADGSVNKQIIIQPREAIVIGGFWDARTEAADDTDNTIDRFIQSWGDDTDADGVGDTVNYRIILLVNTITIANTASLTNEVLEMQDGAGNLIDFQNYQSGSADNVWPFSVNGLSIYLQPNFLNNALNENGFCWAIGQVGVDGNREGREVLVDDNGDGTTSRLYGGGDVASPGYVESSLAASFIDANGNGRDDAIDIFNGFSQDCNRNRIADDGEPDCDGNNIPDACELFIPDVDCDGNGLPDDCEIANNPALDANSNGLLDVCEGVAGNVIITELHFNTPENSDQEFIELYNPTSSPVDISGYFFQDLDLPFPDSPSAPIPDGTILQPGAVLVVGNMTPANFETAWGTGINYLRLNPWNNLAENADLVNEVTTLISASGIRADVVNYSGPTSNGVAQNNWPGSDGIGSNYLRGDFKNATDNNDGRNWLLSISGLDGARNANAGGTVSPRSVGSPGFVPAGAPQRPVGDVIITELMYATNSNEPGTTGFDAPPGFDEWVEIYNRTSSTIDVSGWYLQDEDGRTTGLPAGSTLAAGEVAVIFGYDPSATVTPVSDFYGAWRGGYKVFYVEDWYGSGINRLGDQGEAGTATDPSSSREILTLRTSAAVVQDVVNYDDDGFVWPLVSDGSIFNEAYSIYLFIPSFYNELANDDGFSWAGSLAGLDGARNNIENDLINGPQAGSPGFLDGVTGPLNFNFFPSVDPCAGDLNGDGILDFGDVGIFVNAFGSGDLLADLNGDGLLDFGDVGEFVTRFNDGC